MVFQPEQAPRQVAQTIASDFFSGLDYWRAKLTRQTITPWLIHGGTTLQQREKATVLPWNDLSLLMEKVKGVG